MKSIELHNRLRIKRHLSTRYQIKFKLFFYLQKVTGKQKGHKTSSIIREKSRFQNSSKIEHFLLPPPPPKKTITTTTKTKTKVKKHTYIIHKSAY